MRTGQPRDDDGRTAAAGKVDEDAVARVLKHPFFAKAPPKSLDRNAFRHWAMEEGRLTEKSTEDALATLTAITAASVAHATKVLPRAPAGWLVAGGGSAIRPDANAAQRWRGQHRDGRRGRLVGRCAGGAGLRLSRRANA
jgi:1,6-anhydro-N-acetylmuramate kinase